ncbi:helix-turn-helix domain-containing protein [Mucilaginibacter galii]|uniref:AraC family transcriptional regulator n=1 Tax=Mucilaginibacter galii TaxID=2005073 RepID=A0A917JDW7_9SPHI|nr:helix-turn-helix domain-containing protein [Mucilaginibacter galii]GGI51929.1 AraC family transcriptional regulator [Mucilaginibacter galii]
MHHQEFEPPEELRGTIQNFWHTSIDFDDIPTTGFEVLPDGYTEIIFLFGNACSIAQQDELQPLTSPFLMGLLGKPVLLHGTGRLEVLGIKCFPWTVFDLLRIPPGNDGVRLFKHPIVGLQPSLAKHVEAGQIVEALDELKRYFLNDRKHPATNNMILKAGTAMSEAKGSLPVSRVAEAAHATVRTLERKFKQAAGYTVKDLSGLMRFEEVRNHLWFHPDASLAGLAQELGYADQAHLSKEFKRYSGTTPAAFARKAKDRKWTISQNFVAFVQD